MDEQASKNESPETTETVLTFFGERYDAEAMHKPVQSITVRESGLYSVAGKVFRIEAGTVVYTTTLTRVE